MNVRFSTACQRDLKRLKKQGKNLVRFFAAIDMIANGDVLPERFHDHPLSGNWEGYRDCHIAPDWILIYKIDKENNEVVLVCVRTGSHAELKLE